MVDLPSLTQGVKLAGLNSYINEWLGVIYLIT
jgi:hypothetical protein